MQIWEKQRSWVQDTDIFFACYSSLQNVKIKTKTKKHGFQFWDTSHNSYSKEEIKCEDVGGLRRECDIRVVSRQLCGKGRKSQRSREWTFLITSVIVLRVWWPHSGTDDLRGGLFSRCVCTWKWSIERRPHSRVDWQIPDGVSNASSGSIPETGLNKNAQKEEWIASVCVWTVGQKVAVILGLWSLCFHWWQKPAAHVWQKTMRSFFFFFFLAFACSVKNYKKHPLLRIVSSPDKVESEELRCFSCSIIWWFFLLYNQYELITPLILCSRKNVLADKDIENAKIFSGWKCWIWQREWKSSIRFLLQVPEEPKPAPSRFESL